MNRTIRVLYFPIDSPAVERVVPVADDDKAIDFSETLGPGTMSRLLPDRVMLTSKITLENERVRQVAGYDVRGDFFVYGIDATCSPVSLTDEQVAFYAKVVRAQSQPPLGSTRVVEVADVTVSYRKVEVPAVCKCGADLTRDESIKTWFWQDMGDRGRLPRTAADQDSVHYELGVVLSDMTHGLDCGESFIHNVEITCVACGETLAAGEERIYKEGDGTTPETQSKDEDEQDHDRGTAEAGQG